MMLGICGFLTGLTFLIVLSRCYVRVVMFRASGVDDWIMLFAMVSDGTVDRREKSDDEYCLTLPAAGLRDICTGIPHYRNATWIGTVYSIYKTGRCSSQVEDFFLPLNLCNAWY